MLNLDASWFFLLTPWCSLFCKSRICEMNSYLVPPELQMSAAPLFWDTFVRHHSCFSLPLSAMSQIQLRFLAVVKGLGLNKSLVSLYFWNFPRLKQVFALGEWLNLCFKFNAKLKDTFWCFSEQNAVMDRRIIFGVLVWLIWDIE